MGAVDGGCFSFMRFVDLSPMELYRIMLCGWLYAMQHIEQCLDKYERLRHRHFWWTECPADVKKETDIYPQCCDRVNSKYMLLICPGGDTLRQKKEDSLMWRELLFTDPLWIEGGPFYTHTELTVNYMPETIEHRALRLRNLRERDGQSDMLSEIKTEEGGVIPVQPMELPEVPHVERPPVTYSDVPTPLPSFLFTAQQKVWANTRAPFAVSRSFAYHETRHQHAESAEGWHTVSRLTAAARPPWGWATLQVPDKNQLVSDAGKLTALDSLLKRLKERGHRVLIYSQMTKMIDLLEEYMWHRKHKYMRLDGSSKISARRDMVADFQARSDIFVFLLSTRAGGLGINLTAADTVIFYDSDWNPTVDQQAMDRAHRLGQTKQVTVYRLICKGTIEERIMQRAREKSEIQRMVISGGNFKPDTLKPKEVVSLLLDDEEIELKYRQKSEEKKIIEERERKRKLGLLPAAVSTPPPAPVEAKRPRDSASEPGSPLQVDDDGDNLVVDVPPQSTTPIPYSPPVRSSSWGVTRSSRGARRGRPRGSRHALTRRPPDPAPADNAIAVAAGAALLESDAPLEIIETSATSETTPRGRRGPGRPRLRTAAPRGTSRRARRPREPLLVPLAPPP